MTEQEAIENLRKVRSCGDLISRKALMQSLRNNVLIDVTPNLAKPNKRQVTPCAQKPVKTLKKLIEIFTDEGDVVIDPCCGSGTTLRAAAELNRSAYGFEIDRTCYQRSKDEMLMFDKSEQMSIFDL